MAGVERQDASIQWLLCGEDRTLAHLKGLWLLSSNRDELGLVPNRLLVEMDILINLSVNSNFQSTLVTELLDSVGAGGD
ncbi:hypothetical protein ACFL1V_07905, partial [Pseudomonadota bacterium]